MTPIVAGSGEVILFEKTQQTPPPVGKASLALTDKSPDDKDQLEWKWSAGSATIKTDFGDPWS